MKSVLQSVFGVFGVFLGLYLLTAGGHLYSPDEEVMFRTTESLATTGRLAIEPIRDPSGGTFASRAGVDGREYAQYGVGNSLFALPLYYCGALLSLAVPEDTALRAFDFRMMANLPERGPRGAQLCRRFAVSFFGAVVGAATCALMWRFAWVLAMASQVQAPRRVAWLTALAYGAGTMAWPHARTFFSEPLATFFALLAFYLASDRSLLRGDDARPRRRLAMGLFLSGGAMALSLLTRLDSVVVLPALLALVALRHLEGEHDDPSTALSGDAGDAVRAWFSRRFLATLFWFGLPLAAFGAWHLGMNRIHFGSAWSSGYSDQAEGIRFTTPLLAGLYGFLFSAGKSVFLFSPAVVLGLAGFPLFRRRNVAVAFACAVAVALLLLFHARWQNWAGGWCWGPRHVFMLHAFAILPVSAFVAVWNRLRRLAFVLVMAIAVVVQLYGCSQSFIDFYVLYYRTPFSAPNAVALYSGEDAAPGITRMETLSPDGRWSPASFATLIAPINDTIYVPQNSQWYRYAEMWDLGYTDNLWIRWWLRARGKERPVE